VEEEDEDEEEVEVEEEEEDEDEEDDDVAETSQITSWPSMARSAAPQM